MCSDKCAPLFEIDERFYEFTLQDRKPGVSYQGVRYEQPIDGCAGWEDTKAIVKGKLAVEVMRGESRYGDQLQFTVQGEDVRFCRRRVRGNWNRVEICQPLADGMDMLVRFMRQQGYTVVKNAA